MTRARLVREVGAREARGAGDSPRVRIQVEPRRQVAQPVGVVDERHREGAAAAGVVDDADALDAHHRRERGGHVAAERRRPRHHPELEGGGALAALAARRHDVVDVLESSAGRRAADEPRRRMRDEAEPARQGGARGEGGVAVGGRDGCGGRAQRHGALRERVAHLHVELRGRLPGLVRRERPILVGEHRGARAERREAAADVGRALRHAEPQQRRRHAAVVARHDHVLGGRGGAARRAAHRAVRRVEAEAVRERRPARADRRQVDDLEASAGAAAVGNGVVAARRRLAAEERGRHAGEEAEARRPAHDAEGDGRRRRAGRVVRSDAEVALAEARVGGSVRRARGRAGDGAVGRVEGETGGQLRGVLEPQRRLDAGVAQHERLDGHALDGGEGAPAEAVPQVGRWAWGGGRGVTKSARERRSDSARGRARRAARAHLRPRRTAARSASR